MERWVIVLESPEEGDRAALDLATHIGDSFRILRVGLGPHATSRVGCLRVPVDRGTGPALLLAVFHTLARNADASVVVIPAEVPLHRSHALGEAIEAASRTPCHALSTVHIVAARPPILAAPERWLVPQHWSGGAWPLLHAVFPGTTPASDMIEAGALADTGVLVAHAWTFASLLRECQYGWFQSLREAVAHPSTVDQVFTTLEPVDLFDDVLLPAIDRLRIVPARRRDAHPTFITPSGTAPIGGDIPEALC